ncbi:MAG: helix-turn-helix domain-containing protein [bacterium]
MRALNCGDTIMGLSPESCRRSHHLRVYMNHLRKKIETTGDAPKLIKTEPGIGYRLSGRGTPHSAPEPETRSGAADWQEAP